MSAWDKIGIGLGLKKAENLNKPLPEAANLNMKVIPRQSIRVVQDISKWRAAIQMAESVLYPDRRDLQILFNEIHFDAHISALATTLKQYVQGLEWCIKEPGAENEDEAAEEVLDAKWFQDLINYCIESKIYGYSLVQFGDIVDNKFSKCELIDRRYTVPELHGVRKDLFTYGISFDYLEAPYKDWVIFIGDVKDLGLLNKAAPLFIYKKQALSSWAEYQQILGVPPRMGKTDLRDDLRRTTMQNMLRDMGSNGWMVIDKNDEVEFMQQAGKASAENAFSNMLAYLNKELSKLFVGQTMTTEDGSSKSQSEVHENTFEMIMQGYKQFICDVVNTQVLPLLIRHRLISNPKLRFYFKEKEEEIGFMEKVQVLKDLAPFFTFSPEFVQQYIGLEVEQKAAPAPFETPLKNLKNYYGLEDFKPCADGC